MSVPIEFELNKREKSEDPDVEVLFPAASPAKPGTYVFELIVVDSEGVQSAPVQLNVLLQGDAVAVLNALNVDKKVVSPAVFKPGAKFLLSASDSKSENGAIKSFIWRLARRP